LCTPGNLIQLQPELSADNKIRLRVSFRIDGLPVSVGKGDNNQLGHYKEEQT
jgi:hypothetical protein